MTFKDFVIPGAEVFASDPATCKHETLTKFVDLFNGETFRYHCIRCDTVFQVRYGEGRQRVEDLGERVVGPAKPESS